jgi:hypothetical protein
VLIVYNDEQAGLTRLLRDLLPSLSHLKQLITAELIVIDNSREPSRRLAEAVLRNGEFPAQYRWNDGENLLYGPSLNLAAAMASSSLMLYTCAAHGQMHDPTWAWDLIEPLLDDESADVVMCGSLRASCAPGMMGFDPSLAPLHVQGGVFGARTEVLRRLPYPDGQYAHWGADVYQSFQLMAAGFRLIDVDTVNSLWRAPCQPGSWKYVHQGGT